MLNAHDTIPDVVLQALAHHSIPNSYVNENKFFVGIGADLQSAPQP